MKKKHFFKGKPLHFISFNTGMVFALYVLAMFFAVVKNFGWLNKF